MRFIELKPEIIRTFTLFEGLGILNIMAVNEIDL